MWKLAPVFLDSSNRNPNAPHHGDNPMLVDARGVLISPSAVTNQGHVVVGTESSPLTQCIWTFFWLIVLIVVALPISTVTVLIYVLISPLSAPCACFQPVADFFLTISYFPYLCTKNLAEAKPLIMM